MAANYRGGDERVRRLEQVKQLRVGSTDAERASWRLLRGRRLGGFKFRRQHPFGPFVLDFSCVERRLAVEADGSGHFSGAGEESDTRRTGYHKTKGVEVLRFTNTEVPQTADVVALVIVHRLEAAGLAASGPRGHAGGEG